MAQFSRWNQQRLQQLRNENENCRIIQIKSNLLIQKDQLATNNANIKTV